MAVVHGGRPDVLPRVPILMQFAAEHIGSNYGAFASDYRVLVEANLRCAADFGFDQLSAISDPYRETAGFGAPIEFRRDGVPICLKPPLEDNPDLSNLPRPDPMKEARMRDRIDAVREYKRHVKRLRSIRLPYFATRMLAKMLEAYHHRSQGQLPPIFTRYKVAAAWGGNRFDNAKLHALGWRQLVTTPDAMAQTFAYLRGQVAKQ